MAHVLLLALAPIFFVLALGYLAGRLRRIDNHRVADLNSLVMEFSLPAALFVACASTPRSEMIKEGSLFAILGVAMLIPWLLWYYFRTKVSKLPSGEAAVEAITVSLPNYAAVGIPVLFELLGPKSAVHVAIGLAAASIVPVPFALVLLELDGANGQADVESWGVRVPQALRRCFAKPIVFAPLLGLIFSMSGLEIGKVVNACFILIGQAAGGVALFLTGLILSAQPFALDSRVVVATVVANVIRPLFVTAIVYFFAVPPEIAKVAILLSALPLGFFGILFGVTYKVAFAEAGSMVIASTLVSIATLAAAISILYPS
jgi:malonate transporter